MSDFIQGESVTFFKNFLDINSSPILNGISGVTIDIYHFISSTKVYDTSGTSMIQDIDNPNIYYFNYIAPSVITNYNVVYNGLFSGNSMQSSETFSVLPLTTATIPASIGVGSVNVSGNVVDISGNAINLANVSALSGSNIYASTMTDINGSYNVFLDSGDYLFIFSKDGFFTDQHMNTVPTNLVNFNLGTEILISGTIGTVTISDTYVYKTPSQQQIPIPNLKVEIFSNDSPAGLAPVVTTYTNVSGTFFADLNEGKYVMSVRGEVLNSSGNKHDRYDIIYNIEVDSNFPNNFQYLNTSLYPYLS